jgi:hypothetical protein
LKWLTFAILLGFISFVVHGAFNSFLDTDKVSVLFYAAMAAVVTIDTSHSTEDESLLNNADPGKGAGTLSK